MTQLMHHLMFDPLSEVERLEWTSAFVCSAIVVGVGLSRSVSTSLAC
jgi:hypothetical protein